MQGSNSGQRFDLLQSLLFTAVTRAECHRNNWHKDIYSHTHTQTHNMTLCLLLYHREVCAPRALFALLVFSGHSYSQSFENVLLLSIWSYLFQYCHEYQSYVYRKAMYHWAEGFSEVGFGASNLSQQCFIPTIILTANSFVGRFLSFPCMSTLCLPVLWPRKNNMGFCYQKQVNMWNFCAFSTSQLHRRVQFRVSDIQRYYLSFLFGAQIVLV